MFKLLLITKYLRRKLAPLFAALAVTLCTMMVIIVISVMGGFLDTLRESIQRMSPTVKIETYSMTGLPFYDELCDELEGLPEVESATPIVATLGLMQVMGVRNDVMVLGVRADELNEVVDFAGSLHWREEMFVAEAKRVMADPEASAFRKEMLAERLPIYEGMDLVGDGLAMKPGEYWLTGETAGMPGIVTGVATIPFNRRDDNGKYLVGQNALGDVVTLTVVPISEAGALQEPVLRRFVIANEFKSGHYDFDSSLVFVPFDVLQRMLRMETFEAVASDPETGEETGGTVTVPGRATEIFVKGVEGVALDVLAESVDRQRVSFVDRYEDRAAMPMSRTVTWEEDNAVILGAVQNEKGLVTFLFVIISVVAIVMVATTFYMIVLEKTRDIGVLRAIGASRSGIAGVFLGYGLCIGVVGSVAGLLAAWAIVANLNEIQMLLDQWFGWRMWDPRIYAFDTIPARVDFINEAIPIVIGGVISSVIGALIPALLASRLNPVEALRHE